MGVSIASASGTWLGLAGGDSLGMRELLPAGSRSLRALERLAHERLKNRPQSGE